MPFRNYTFIHPTDGRRRYAYQVLLVEELRRHAVETVFLNRAIGVSPEETCYCRCKACLRNTNGRRSWNVAVAAKGTPP